jgi:hypothetical protein
VVGLGGSFGLTFEPDTFFASLERFGEVRRDWTEAAVPAAGVLVVYRSGSEPLGRKELALHLLADHERLLLSDEQRLEAAVLKLSD